jgi:hypothetical protein
MTADIPQAERVKAQNARGGTVKWAVCDVSVTREGGMAEKGGPVSVDGPGGDYPFAGLAGDPADQVEVRVVVKQDEAALLGRGGDQEVGDLAAAETPRGKEPCEASVSISGKEASAAVRPFHSARLRAEKPTSRSEMPARARAF